MSSFAPMLGRYSRKENQPTVDGTVVSVLHPFTDSLTRETAEEKLRILFNELSPKAMVDHVILGHFKGAIRFGDALFAISVTRENVLDEAGNASWRTLKILPEGEVTVNLLSVVPVPVSEQELKKMLELLF